MKFDIKTFTKIDYSYVCLAKFNYTNKYDSITYNFLQTFVSVFSELKCSNANIGRYL